MTAAIGYLYLNDADEWPTFDRHQLEIVAGALRLEPQASGLFHTRGLWMAGPYSAGAEPTDWYRLRAFAEQLPPRTHVQLFTATSDDVLIPPVFDPSADEPFPASQWAAEPVDALDVLLPGPPSVNLWIGGLVRSDGGASPVVHQMRLDYGRDTSLGHLPAIYARPEANRDFLERFLSLQESVLGGIEREVIDLARLFDAEASPAAGTPSWLNWLSGWLALDVSEAWTEEQTRAFISQAYALYGRRGTKAAIARYIKMYSGLDAHVEEPIQSARVWSLGETSALGFDTMLSPEPPEGAVLDASAVVDRSHVRDDDAVPALADLAHRFCVLVHCTNQSRPGALDDARAVLEREKPAHTEGHLCVLQPRLQVGMQARVGIDAIVGGTPSFVLGEPLHGVTLASTARPCSIEQEQ